MSLWGPENESIGGHVCAPEHVGKFDNFLRPLIHPGKKVFGPHVKAGDTVLDVGCGAGWATLAMGRLVGGTGSVTAADLQPEMLDKVRARAMHAGLNGQIRYHLCETDRIGVTGNFDFVNAFWMVHELPDPRSFFAEAASLLAEGGRVLFAEPKGHVTRRSFEKELSIAQSAGLAVADRPKVRFSHAALLAAAT